MTRTPPLMELRDVSRDFLIKTGLFGQKKILRAVRSVSMDIERGDVIALVGESGCGKTTLARMLMNVLEPTSGDILYEGKPSKDRSAAERSRKLQAVFQDPYSSLNPRKTIGSIISLPLRIHGDMAPAAIRSETLKIMDKVGLPARVYDNYPNQLSGGQRQRVAIARALILKPEIVICDEPTSALDVSVQSQILNLLIDMKHEFKLTYVLISHNLGVVEHLASKVAVMYLGRIVEMAACEELFSSPRHPYTKALLASIMAPDPDLDIPDVELGIAFPNAMNPPAGCAFHPRCNQKIPICSREQPGKIEQQAAILECHLFSNGKLE
jgi:peptide/nickel transport system ATP-binding protein